jgi:hypothetical protein
VVKRRFAAAFGALALVGVTAGVAGAEDKKVMFQFQDDRITESSGLAASAIHDGIVYTHNDSGHGPDIYAVDDSSGATVATLTLKGAPSRDWEAISKCKDHGTDVLWVGDIGDNINAWKTYRLFRVPEPSTLKTGDVDWTEYDLRYEDGQARNAESLLCDPRDGRLYVITKETADKAGVYRGPSALKAGAVNVFSKIANAPAAMTDGAFFGGGRFAVVRGYFDAYILSPNAGWKPVVTFTPPIQIQGESVAETKDGSALLFGSEGVGSSVWRVPIPAEVNKIPNSSLSAQDAKDAAVAAKDKAAAAKNAGKNAKDKAGESKTAAKRVNDQGIPGIDGPMVALFSALGLGILILVLATRRD